MTIITISGRARAGKDTTAMMMKPKLESLGCRVLITHYADLLKFICKNFFGWDGKKDEYGRTLLQYVGTDVVRTKDPDYWVDFLVKIAKLFNDRWDFILIPDTRFPNEISKFVEAGFNTIHIRIIRPGFQSALTDEQKMHISEVALDSITPDFSIINDATLSELDIKISTWIEENIKNGNYGKGLF